VPRAEDDLKIKGGVLFVKAKCCNAQILLDKEKYPLRLIVLYILNGCVIKLDLVMNWSGRQGPCNVAL
jgi:hypothetical protein